MWLVSSAGWFVWATGSALSAGEIVRMVRTSRGDRFPRAAGFATLGGMGAAVTWVAHALSLFADVAHAAPAHKAELLSAGLSAGAPAQWIGGATWVVLMGAAAFLRGYHGSGDASA